MVARPTADRSTGPAGGPFLGADLARTAKALGAWVDGTFRSQGSSLADWILLQQVADTDDAPSQRDLAEAMSIGGATLVRQLDRLEADGLVRRDTDPRDRRVTRISLTPSGEQHLTELATIAGGVDRELRAVITEREERELHAVLARLRAHTAKTTR